jgi:hypothetical protein
VGWQALSLQLDVEDRCGVVEGNRYMRRIVIDRAPALFLVQCGDPRYTDGEHDLTAGVMAALRSRKTSCQGEDKCGGSVGPSACSRVIQFQAIATYRPEPHNEIHSHGGVAR